MARRPRTDPGKRNYRTGLLPWVITLNRHVGKRMPDARGWQPAECAAVASNSSTRRK
jgi:hypothetical protein